ncbi:hypothetical protein BJY01DRAFT_107004 [Aspergillus pseudoustus]|uniref:F-box domain-containing protein n=1 Tax=Aspergillus pseudoustus TaxID=1810923 RepID=A0ABR4IV53_9EURO
MPRAHSLGNLPPELQCAIIRYLDPIALISTSQTNKYFRALINRKKKHFAERLIALECLEEFGGPEITFSRLGTVGPDRTSPEWESNRWACTACLRFLPYQAFTNKAVSQLAYRKPIRGSPAARKCTSWEPTPSPDTRRKTRAKRPERDITALDCDGDGDQALGRRYAVTTTQNWGRHRVWESHSDDAFQLLTARLIRFQEAGLVEFRDMDVHTFFALTEAEENELLDREARAIELLRAGYNRHHRRCLECRFQRGELRGCTGAARGLGTANLPIIPGRRVSFGTVVDRYFPDISSVLQTKRPPFNAPVFVIHRDPAIDRPWTLYRMRCPGCQRWQELRAFRFGGIYPRFEPREMPLLRGHADWHLNWDNKPVKADALENLRCNCCLLEASGTEELGQILVTWLTTLVEAQLTEFTGNLRTGFNGLCWRMRCRSKKDTARTRALVWDMRRMLDKDALDITRMDVALMRQRRIEWLDMYPQFRDGDREEHGLWFEPDKFMWQWVEQYEESEALWFWLQNLRDELQEEGKAALLVQWALARDEARHS